jgi:hypothetical protein
LGNWALSEALAEFAQFPKFGVPQMLPAKRAGARLGYPTALLAARGISTK